VPTTEAVIHIEILEIEWRNRIYTAFQICTFPDIPNNSECDLSPEETPHLQNHTPGWEKVILLKRNESLDN
jgi:hypothetical protein